MLTGKNIVVGVAGGIAAYKAAEVVSRLKKLGATVYVVMTKNSTEFVAPLTFQSISQNYVVTDMFEDPKTWDVEHISLAQRADLFLIAPATANIVGKVAGGIADDMLSTTLMATEAPVFFALAMNTKMYENKLFQANVERLKEHGYFFIEPDSGRLACGDIGAGKLAEPIKIVERVCEYFREDQKLAGKRILVTAGPTREYIDPVRYITNRSSGKMGYAIAEEAAKQGAEVILISGPTHIEVPKGLVFIPVETTQEMYDAVMKHQDVDAVIKAAAPSDYKPVSYSDEKIKKSTHSLNLEMIKNPDILKTLGESKKDKILIGFAAETRQLETYALEKLKDKNLDFIIANDVKQEGAGFDVDTNIVTIFSKDGTAKSFECLSKKELAKHIIELLIKE